MEGNIEIKQEMDMGDVYGVVLFGRVIVVATILFMYFDGLDYYEWKSTDRFEPTIKDEILRGSRSLIFKVEK